MAERRGFLSRIFGRKAREVDGMPITEFPPAITDLLRLYGSSWTNLGSMYRQQPAVRTVVDFLARNVAALSLKVYERIDDDDRKELDEHDLAQLLRKPNPEKTRYQHMFDTVADTAIYDRAYWLKIRQSGRVLAVFRVPVPQVTVDSETDARTSRVRYRWLDGTPIPREDLVIFGGYSPESNIAGTPPLETLRRVLAEEFASSIDRENFWRNAARHAGIIERPADAPEWSDEEFERFRRDWEASMSGGSNAGRTGILEDGMKWNSASFSPKEAQYLEGRKLAREEVARSYGIPPTLVGILEHATFSNITEQHKNLYQDVLSPWLRRIQDEIERQLLPEFEVFDEGSRVYIEFNIAEKLRGSFEEQTSALTSSTGAPWMGINEARARMNLPRIENELFDVPVMPSNVIYGGQPAPNVPLEVPAAEGERPALRALAAEPDHAGATERVLRKFVDRQRRSVSSAAGAGKRALDEGRWNTELAADIRGAALAVATYYGEKAAAERGVGWDADGAEGFCSSYAKAAAERINSRTKLDLVEHEPGEVYERLESELPSLARNGCDFLEHWARAQAAAGAMAIGSGISS